MLEYCKTILLKVSFSKAIFEKELRKAISLLIPHEIADLRAWCYKSFGQSHKNILNNCFI